MIAHGVYYNRSDYAGIWRRLLIGVVDAAVTSLLLYVLNVVSYRNGYPHEDFTPMSLALCFVYLAGLKATPVGTLGYLLAGVKLVDLQGMQVSIWRSAFRFGFLVFGPIFLLVDVLWVGGDPDRQSIVDKLAGTYLVRKKAPPRGEGVIRYNTYFMLTYDFVFAEVEKGEDEGVPPQSPGAVA